MLKGDSYFSCSFNTIDILFKTVFSPFKAIIVALALKCIGGHRGLKAYRWQPFISLVPDIAF